MNGEICQMRTIGLWEGGMNNILRLLLVTTATLVVTGALLVVTKSYILALHKTPRSGLAPMHLVLQWSRRTPNLPQSMVPWMDVEGPVGTLSWCPQAIKKQLDT